MSTVRLVTYNRGMEEARQRDSEATKRRLLGAAREELASFGIAGARVERIAGKARANKAQIYHYFGSKEGLFDAVFAGLVSDVTAAVPIDVDDLAGYAARLFDGYEDYPEIARLATWQRLERADAHGPPKAVVDSTKVKVAAIERAQEGGRLTTTLSADELLAAIIHTAALWTTQTPQTGTLIRDIGRERRRQVVVSIVQSILDP